ncbi:hypothetical protein T11_17253 [Trichinella zimbabwensis]|uniref:Uncharacterized protein n=1 Tax=Trichinella zimbabwensis TaxID=268475 RepID=A0A0V1GDC5_9BILA|nr:hypothetical protein T11_17253 [Trichinella zimbabwensis]
MLCAVLLLVWHGDVFPRTTPPFFVRPGAVTAKQLCTVLVRP